MERLRAAGRHGCGHRRRVVGDDSSPRMGSARDSKCPAGLAREFDRDEEAFWIEVAISRFVDDADQIPGLRFGIRDRPIDLPDDERSTEASIGDAENIMWVMVGPCHGHVSRMRLILNSLRPTPEASYQCTSALKTGPSSKR